MRAELIYREKYIYADSAIREMVLWKLPEKTPEHPQGLKYRLYYGLPDGTPVVPYDNEAGKGHHRHLGNREEPYRFRNVETLVADFLQGIEEARGGAEMKRQIEIGVGDAASTAEGFADAWNSAVRGETLERRERLNFENLHTLLKTLTPKRWILLKILRQKGPMSVRGLSRELDRDYKNVYTDVKRLEQIGLIGRTRDLRIQVPWDIVEARLKLAA